MQNNDCGSDITELLQGLDSFFANCARVVGKRCGVIEDKRLRLSGDEPVQALWKLVANHLRLADKAVNGLLRLFNTRGGGLL